MASADISAPLGGITGNTGFSGSDQKYFSFMTPQKEKIIFSYESRNPC